jgi:hypothetical protein
MPVERSDRLRVIGITAVVTCVATLAVAATVVTVVSRRPPPTPQLAPPKAITVTLYPVDGVSTERRGPTEIPAGDFGQVMRLVTPGKFYEGGVNDKVIPLIAEVVITHEGQPDTRLLVRWTGKNPAAISVDGHNYFYGVSHPDIHDGAMQLFALVERLAKVKAP